MAKTPDEILEEARKLIGTETPVTKGRYPVEYDPIRRFCQMTGDRNPLFLDPEYAAKTRFGSVICPPALVHLFAGVGWPTQTINEFLALMPALGDRPVNLTVEAEWYKPVRVGDQLYEKMRLVDVYMKPTKLDPKTFWFVVETIITNQDGDVVCIDRTTRLRHRTPEQIAQAGE